MIFEDIYKAYDFIGKRPEGEYILHDSGLVK